MPRKKEEPVVTTTALRVAVIHELIERAATEIAASGPDINERRKYAAYAAMWLREKLKEGV